MKPWSRTLALLVALISLLGCGNDDGNGNDEITSPEPTETYRATVTRTSYGIPHIRAEDWGGLGYGLGYAYAQDNFCVLMREVVLANGESARYFGSGGNIDDDLLYRYYNADQRVRDELLEAIPADMRDLIAGYTAGFNRYLDETGADALAEGNEGCRGAEWVRPLSDTDLSKVLRKALVRAGIGALSAYIGAVEGPDAAAMAALREAREKGITPQRRIEIAANARPLLPEPEMMGSNAYAFGANVTTNGKGLLLGNPHFPWTGSLRWYVSHLTIPGEYDVMGASLAGVPVINIGFNGKVAWSHTVSTGRRFTAFELTVDSEDPMKYVYGDELREITAVAVPIERKLADGSIETIERTLYITEFGPVIDLGALSSFIGGWPNALGTIYAVRDVNVDNFRGLQMWKEMGQATSLEELLEATAIIGNPWTNTIAVDAEGNGAYGDISAVPHVTTEQWQSCIRGLVAPLLTDFGLPTLDGSDPACAWGSDEDAPVEGVFGYAALPKLVTRDYAGNSNDSYWLSNPDQLLEGYSPIIGRERSERSLRTRLGFVMARERIQGTDGLGEPLWDVAKLQQAFHGNRNYAAELVLDDVLDICEAVTDWSDYSDSPEQVAEACGILASWDRTSRVEAVGAHVFREFWARLRATPSLWAYTFDASQAVDTPNTLNIGNAAVVEAVKQSLADGVQALLDAGIALDLPWGEVQFSERNGERIPIPGSDGMFSFGVISSRLVDGEGYSDIPTGNSYIQTVGWDGSECPDAYAVLTYSQSSDPASAHYADMTRLYSEGKWVDMPYCADDVEADKIGEATELFE